VTGGGNGLGQQISIKLAKLGCNVAVVDIDFASAQTTADNLRKLGVSAQAYRADVSNFNEIVKLKQQILADLGEVDVLVNNAGIIAYKTIFEQTAEEIERLTNVNFNGVIFVSALLSHVPP
jgi:NAD(P)-dependent dehydrogenase (short-subunit alcohol dehydrogenase family)